MRISARPCPRMPTSAKTAGSAGGAGPYVTGLARLEAAGLGNRLCHRRAAGRVMVRQGGLAHPLAPPGAPSPRVEDGKKGQGGPAPLKKISPPGGAALAVPQKHGYHAVMNRSEAVTRLKGCA